MLQIFIMAGGSRDLRRHLSFESSDEQSDQEAHNLGSNQTPLLFEQGESSNSDTARVLDPTNLW